jgi:proton-dependent oligopeptide transporter, POT family
MQNNSTEKVNLFRKFPQTFWVANSVELFERFAWYGFYMLFANYLTGSAETGGLELSQAEKGTIMGIGTALLYFLPVLTGSIADRYGYKNLLVISFIVYISAFICMPLFHTFYGVLFIYIYLALGGALFKPVISATIAKTTDDTTASIGFGIFYMMVNIGAFLGPLVTLMFKKTPEYIFYISAGLIAVNFVLLLFYKEPGTEKPKTGLLVYMEILGTLISSIFLFVSVFMLFLVLWVIELPLFFLKYGTKLSARWVKLVLNWPIGESNKKVFENITGIFFDTKFITFLIIVAGFWSMYFQLFYTLPVFISQWVDTSQLYDFFDKVIPFVTSNYSAGGGQLDAEFIVNFDAMYIILLQIIVSSVVMRLRPLQSMTVGFLVCTIGMSLTLLSQNVLFTIVAILIFALGEMAGSPKITEYIGRIAPADKKGVYMGYSFIPVFIGNIFAGIISGAVYQAMSDKTSFVQIESRQQGVLSDSTLSINETFNQLALKMNMEGRELTNYLWDKYNPSSIWMVLMAIGLIAVIALFFYDKYVIKEKKPN